MPKVMIIDDDELFRGMLLQMMEREGIDAVGTFNGKEGLQIIDSYQPDLIITDIVMPDKEGLETIIELRQHYKHIPIIAVSGGGKVHPDVYLSTAKQFGANYAFSKPLNRTEFLSAVIKCLGKRA
ncbi:response regulator [Chitinispirillales bacterium ANBcel5]|uniref:response regulator n=1 Tax=Cellulosispirillum alkaliphilum TaxID=3039283 RepID=UPI002A4F877C|nr:response regulator [Chitinispirillales bacterium ANBcel5]